MEDLPIKKASELIGAFFDNQANAQKGNAAVKIFKEWSYLVGGRLAAHSSIIDIRDGILEIETDHPGWIQVFQIKQKEIIKNVNRSCPEFAITAISVRLISKESGKIKTKEKVDAINSVSKQEIEKEALESPEKSTLPPELKEMFDRLGKGLRTRSKNR